MNLHSIFVPLAHTHTHMLKGWAKSFFGDGERKWLKKSEKVLAPENELSHFLSAKT